MPRADARGRRACSLRSWQRLVAVALVVILAAGCTPDRAADPVEAPADEPTEAAPDETSPDAGSPDADAGGDGADDDAAAGTGREEPQPAPAPAPALDPPPPPPGRDALVAEASRMLAAALDEATSGDLAVLVVDEFGREIVAHAPDQPVIPASTLKVVTAAAILTTLGPRHRLTTRVESTAPIDADGTVRGDVVLIGSGDPVLSTPEYARWVYPARPRTPLDELADRLVDQGLTHIEGDVLAAAPGFSGPRTPEGWPDRYFSSFDARYADGLTVDAGLRTIVTYPEAEGGSEAEDGSEDDDSSDLTNGTSDDPNTTDEDPADADDDAEDADPDDVDEDLGPPDVKVDHAPEPAMQAVAEFVRLLEERGVEVDGEIGDGELDAPVVARLAEVESPPMFDLLRFAMQRSDNQITDGLFRLAGLARTGTGSFESGERALRQVLDRYDIGHDGAVFADGSGLSREDRVTVRMLVDLDRAMAASRHYRAWNAIMASMGDSGTLERRLRGSVAQGRFLGKTGTLQDVSALSGAVVDAEERSRYHLAVIANDAGATRGVARALTDELILLLVAELDGCDVDRPGETDGPIGLPALAVRC